MSDFKSQCLTFIFIYFSFVYREDTKVVYLYSLFLFTFFFSLLLLLLASSSSSSTTTTILLLLLSGFIFSFFFFSLSELPEVRAKDKVKLKVVLLPYLVSFMCTNTNPVSQYSLLFSTSFCIEPSKSAFCCYFFFVITFSKCLCLLLILLFVVVFVFVDFFFSLLLLLRNGGPMFVRFEPKNNQIIEKKHC